MAERFGRARRPTRRSLRARRDRPSPRHGPSPFSGETIAALAHEHTQVPYAPPRAKTPPAAYLFNIIERLLHKAPEERYATADQVANELARLAEEPLRISSVDDDVAMVGALRIRLLEGDIAQVANDVIVNAANSELTMDHGVAAALRSAGGDDLETESQAKLLSEVASPRALVPMGTVVWTGAGDLTARWVAHAVSAMEGAVCIQRCTLRALLEADQRGAISIAFPALGTGVGQVPMALAAKLMLETFVTFASLDPAHVRSINVVLYDTAALEVWRSVLEAM